MELKRDRDIKLLAKLDNKKVIKIRKLQGHLSSRKVGTKFNISKSQILHIWNNKSWIHVK